MTTEVRVTDIDMRFSSMVVFMLKWALASIPAAIILFGLACAFWVFVLAVVVGAGAHAVR